MKDVIEAVIAKLKATSGVTSLVSTRIHKALPLTPRFPCLLVMAPENIPWDTKDAPGDDVLIQIDTWTRSQRDMDDAHDIMNAVKSALHEQTLTISGLSHVLTRLQMATVLQARGVRETSQDGATMHGVQRFRILTHS